MSQRERSSDRPASSAAPRRAHEPALRRTDVQAPGGDRVAVVPSRAVAERFLGELPAHTDGIGFVQALRLLAQRGVLGALSTAARAGAAVRVGELAARSGANLGYLAVLLRVLAAQGYARRDVARSAAETTVSLTPLGAELCALVQGTDACDRVSAFTPVALRLRDYLDGTFAPPEGAPSLADLARSSQRAWHLDAGANALRIEAAVRLRAALDGNLLGPVAVAFAEELARAALSGAAPSLAERGDERHDAAREVLQNAGWLAPAAPHGLTALGTYAAPRALAFGVPVSYLPLFARLEELVFGDAESAWVRAPGAPEPLVDRALNVRASGASHRRYFAAADEVVRAAFDRPFAEQPAGFCDMGSGDGAWLEHVFRLIVEDTERGRLLRERPGDPRYVPVMIGADYNAAARSATAERLTRAGIPHHVVFGDIADPERLRRDLAARGIDSRRLLHGSSFLMHNRPFLGVRDAARAARRAGIALGAYAWRGRAVPNAEVEQSLVELFEGWAQVIGAHGMLVIELHDPEVCIPGQTLTSYILTHGLSDQFCVSLPTFLAAAREARIELGTAQLRTFPNDRALAAVSVSHFRAAVR